jgi:hypothetical protein
MPWISAAAIRRLELRDNRAVKDSLSGARSDKILVHCAANYRVTAFVGLYRVLCEGWPADRAFEAMRSVWEPDLVWKQFIANMLGRTFT